MKQKKDIPKKSQVKCPENVHLKKNYGSDKSEQE